MVEVFDIIAAYGVNCHCYADDMQVYASVPVSMADAKSLRLADCIIQLDQWMSKNRLKLNSDKTTTYPHNMVNFSPLTAETNTGRHLCSVGGHHVGHRCTF